MRQDSAGVGLGPSRDKMSPKEGTGPELRVSKTFPEKLLHAFPTRVTPLPKAKGMKTRGLCVTAEVVRA